VPKKRRYRLGKRQASVDETRRRILTAAVAEYEKSGIDETTMLAVARRAHVASGTVLYHYPEPRALADAVVNMWIEEANLPDAPEVPNDLSLQKRADLLVSTVFEMLDEDHPAAHIYQRSPQHPAMKKLQHFWDERLSVVASSTLGTYMSEADRPVIAAIIGGQFLANLARRGIPTSELGETVSRLIAAWLTSRPHNQT
jgi:AcrR family transcriptional regulator